jgi:hypothetical protein
MAGIVEGTFVQDQRLEIVKFALVDRFLQERAQVQNGWRINRVGDLLVLRRITVERQDQDPKMRQVLFQNTGFA